MITDKTLDEKSKEMKTKYLSIGKLVEAMKRGIEEYQKYGSSGFSDLQNKYLRHDLPWYKETYVKYVIIGFADEAARYHEDSLVRDRLVEDAYKTADVLDSKHAQRYLKRYHARMKEILDKRKKEFGGWTQRDIQDYILEKCS